MRRQKATSKASPRGEAIWALGPARASGRQTVHAALVGSVLRLVSVEDAADARGPFEVQCSNFERYHGDTRSRLR